MVDENVIRQEKTENKVHVTTSELNRTTSHVVSLRVLVTVWVALIVLTIVTVGVSGVDLGRFNVIAALLIAAAKASLVLLYFMHLRYDHPLHAFIFIVGLSFVALFIISTTTDTWDYQKFLEPPLDMPTNMPM